MIVHLLEFRVVLGHEAEVSGFLRNALSSDRLPEGLTWRCVGRRLSRQQREHVLVTLWRDEQAYKQGVRRGALPALVAPIADVLRERKSAAFQVAAAHGHGCDGSRILRVYRASVHSDELAVWERRVGERANALAARPGLVSVMVGASVQSQIPAESVAVVAVSAWRDWDDVLAATGDHIDRQIRETELLDLEIPLGVDHYQLLGVDHYQLLDVEAGPREGGVHG